MENVAEPNWKFWLNFIVLVIALLVAAAALLVAILSWLSSNKQGEETNESINNILLQLNETQKGVNAISDKINETNKKMEVLAEYTNKTEVNTKRTAEATEESALMQQQKMLCDKYDSRISDIDKLINCQREKCFNNSENLSLETNEISYSRLKYQRSIWNCSIALELLDKISCNNESQCGYTCYHLSVEKESRTQEEGAEIAPSAGYASIKFIWILIVFICLNLILLITLIFYKKKKRKNKDLS